MHAELEAELGADDAATALTQVGLIHGLQDAWRVLSNDGSDAPILPPPLAIRFAALRNPEPPGAVELVGSWPERTEAGAHLSLLGPCTHVACHLSAGYTSGWLSGTMDADILALETECAAAGAPVCRFVAREAESWRRRGDARAEALLASLPFEALRDLVQSRGPAYATDQGGLEQGGAVVHIWGPVMVVPFAGGEEALRAVELIERDPAARDVSVIVVDLTGAVLDEAFGAMTLEQIIETADHYEAETILAAVSPLSEAVVAGLDRRPLAVHKDLSEAVAAAFQVATAQRILV